MALSAYSKGQKVLFSTTKEIEDGACKDNALYFKAEKVVEVDDIVLPDNII